ncbi:hypothetical protein PHET_09019 [Paragonimus heterotremus]|uniref:Peptidase S1 domain-containing protein n=1 Tax=Paragonimus heterotremus TaxID=100268 RepID=A0A8J4SZC7_9TREM|nr:hypothetical protein PHET_09019 [Paragonimus heterotremus]
MTKTQLCALALNVQNKTGKRIINGSPAPEGRVPWAGQMKAVRNNINWRNCGVTVISTHWLLTAAHCIYHQKKHTQREQIMDKRSAARNQSDVLYENSLQGYYPNQRRRILHFHAERIVVHPNYQTSVLFHDIALIKVRGQIPIDGTYIAIASLPPAGNSNNVPEVGSQNYIVGFGCRYSGGDVVNRAHVLQLKTNTKQECVYAYGPSLVNYATQFCAGYFNQNTGVCLGDSGSGLISFQYGRPMIVGVASAAVKSDMGNSPGKFVRVASYVSWIRQYVG